MEPTFTVGDIIRIKKDCTGCLKGKNYKLQTDYQGDLVADRGNRVGCTCRDNWELVKSSEVKNSAVGSINFILQYDLDTDPFETFSTLTEVKDRIKVLAQRSDLKRDSLKLYHIAKMEKVELSTAIAFISADEKPVEQVKTKSKAKQPCPQCGKKFKRLNSHIARSHKK